MSANSNPSCAAFGNVDGVSKTLMDVEEALSGVAGGGDADLVGDGWTVGLSTGRSLTVGLMLEASVLIGGLLCRELRFVGDLE
jgi:hypothetical protein